SYDSFGTILSDSNSAFAVPFGFAGGLHDRDTGLVKFGFRDYDPAIGRWVAKDPIFFAGGDVDLYGYVLGDPVNFVDPDGLRVSDTFKKISINAIEFGLGYVDSFFLGIPSLVNEKIFEAMGDEDSLRALCRTKRSGAFKSGALLSNFMDYKSFFKGVGRGLFSPLTREELIKNMKGVLKDGGGILGGEWLEGFSDL
ncbi:MAG: RHS repeat-associated core domain-containing protein, partial [Candidatus Electrothrix sp. AX2]|nr:RHS repeat-associated core domain-containing protein [Candidatus Electrothrix gigas]